MVGPDINGLGGISRVVRIWKTNGFFDDFNIIYIESVSDHVKNKFLHLLRSLEKYIILLISGVNNVYIHTSSYNSFRRKIAFIIIAIILNKEIIIHIHPTHFYHYLCKAKRLEKSLILEILNRVNTVIVLTEDMKIKIERTIKTKNIYILPNAVDIKKMQAKKKYVRKENNLLYLGWYIKEKGVYELIDAIEILNNKGIDIKIEFCGTKEINKLREYVSQKGLNNQIEINGWVDGGKKIELLYSCTALILPSHSEGMPNVILEAMATKTPIIATHVGGLKSILRNNENAIIVKEKNVRDICEKIEYCINQKKLRKRIAKNAYYDAVNKYDVSVINKKFKKILYENIIAS